MILLCGAVFFLSLNAIQAQNIQYSQDQIIGKWILKSASYNGTYVSLENSVSPISFEFSLDGKVKYIALDGKMQESIFQLKENQIIDPKVPEYANADILELTKNAMVLKMQEEYNKVLMTFEIDK